MGVAGWPERRCLFRFLQKIFVVFRFDVLLASQLLEMKFKLPGLFGGLKFSDKYVPPGPATIS